MENRKDALTSRALKNYIHECFSKLGVELFGIADLRGMCSVKDGRGKDFCAAISFALPMNPRVMAAIEKGPNQYYAEEYERVNGLIDTISSTLAGNLESMSYQAKALHASDRTDPVNLKGDFPHKTAATRAGLGWIGRNCQLITRQFGPWIRLGTVFMECPGEYRVSEAENLHDSRKQKMLSENAGDDSFFGSPFVKSFCGECQECVQACPANALTGNLWSPGLIREKILDARCCDRWKKEHYYHFHKGHNCGICAAVCPFGKKQLGKKQTL